MLKKIWRLCWVWIGIGWLAACGQTGLNVDGSTTAVAQLPPTVPATLTPTSTATASSTPTAVPPTPTPSQTPTPTITPTPTASPYLPVVQQTAVSPADETVDVRWLDRQNSGAWRYAANSFLHPIALELADETAYLLDGGRVLALDLAAATGPQLLLAPGDWVEGTIVLEPLDLSLADDGLLVLDRAGDLYRYDFAQAEWSLARYDRPIDDMSSHYYMALSAPVLVESSYNFALQFASDGGADRYWLFPAGTRPLDVSVVGTQSYVLLQDTSSLTATVRLYEDAAEVSQFQATVEISRPRQLVATATAVFVLDSAGERLLVLDATTGVLQQMLWLPPVSSFWTDGQQIILAGQEHLYFVDQPGQWQTISGGDSFHGRGPHQTGAWDFVPPLATPVWGTFISPRDLQMVGAPRHYRLGVHEGIDFYWGIGTPVWAVADGTVVRATHEYELPTEQAFDLRRQQLLARGYSTEEDIDFYRGRQIWVEHADGSVARYVHLGGIEADVQVGTAVMAGQLIGQIGNSGSPASANGSADDAHLHFELWLDGYHLGQFLRPVEVRELLLHIFDPLRRAP